MTSENSQVAGQENEQWPSLALEQWQDPYATLHRWSQIVGKIRLSHMPWINHSWHVPLYVSARGLTTSPMPVERFGEYPGDPPGLVRKTGVDARTFEIEFDFISHRLLIQVSDGTERALPLLPQSVALFHDKLIDELEDLGIHISIYGRPNELEDATPFAQDHTHASYDPEYANRFWRVLVQADRVLQEFRSRFIGKVSPVHFFWGSFDMAVTRFSGRPAPSHPGGIPHLPDWITREAYSHEVSSAGFWPGGDPHPFPLFYSYAYPEPDGFAQAKVEPDGAFYSSELHEFILPYDVVRQASAPGQTLLMFLESTYAAAADLGAWDRQALERAEDPRLAALP